MLRLYKFGTVELPEEDGADSYEVGAVSGVVSLRNGGCDTLGPDLVLTPRQVSRSFKVFADGGQTVGQRVDALLAEFGKGERLLQAVTRDGEVRQTPAKVSEVGGGWGVGELPYQELGVTFECPYPYWVTRADEPVYLDDGYALDGSWVVTAGHVESQAIAAVPHSFTISNSGGAPVPKGYFELVPRAGASLTNPKVANSANGMWFQHVGVLDEGDDLTVEFLPQAVTLNGAPAYSSFAVSSAQAGFMVLELGANQITVTADAIAGIIDLRWQWARHWL